MIYYFFGSDQFRAGRELNKLKAELLASGYQLRVFSSETENWLTELRQWLQTNSIFSEKQALILRFEKLSASDKKELRKILSFPLSPERVLILFELSDKPTLELDKVEKREFSLPTPKQPRLWQKYLDDLAQELGISLTTELRDYLLALEIKEPAYFYQELFKLSLYRPGEKLSLRDFFQLNNQETKLSYFDWIKAVLEGDLAKSLAGIPTETDEGLARLRNLINLFELLIASKDKTVSVNLTVAKAEFLSKANPYWLKNLNRWARGLSLEKAVFKLKQLLELELKIKTGIFTVQEGLRIFCLS